VELYAEFEPDRLLQFLSASQSYPLEPALRVCQDRGFIREQARRCLCGTASCMGACTT